LWDVDDNGTIDHDEMKNGIRKLGYDPSIQMSSDDWENFSLHGLLLNEDLELDPPSFELAMRFQLADYSQVQSHEKTQNEGLGLTGYDFETSHTVSFVTVFAL